MTTIRRHLKVDQKSAAAKHAKDWHWGVPAKQVIDWRDPDVDRNLRGRDVIEIGRLVELRVKGEGDRKLTHLTIPKRYVEQCHAVFDRAHKYQRIYLFIVPAVCEMLADSFDPANALDLRDYAEEIGHRHGTRDYPNLLVTPLGRVHDIVYKVEKGSYEEGDEPDGLSEYIHRFAEEGGKFPGLGVDSVGRLWLAGGSYQAPRPGITD